MRYADDGRIYVRSERAGLRVMESITQYVEQCLKLHVNRQKSAVAPAVDRPLLGFEFFRDKAGQVRVTVAPKALKRAQERIRQLTPRNWSISMERRIKEINRFTVGWTAYFLFRRHLPAVRQAREAAAAQAQTGALERVEAPPNALPEPPDAGYLRPRRSLMDSVAEGLLAHRRLLAAPTSLPNAYWPTSLGLKGFLDPYRRFREC